MDVKTGCDHTSEAVIVALACLSPWAFGAVEAWSEALVYLGVTLVALLGVVTSWGADRTRQLLSAPSLALAGLTFLGVWQAAPLPERVLRWVAPSVATLRAVIVPARPDGVLSDPGPRVPPPARTISQHREMTADAATRLAVAWVLAQGVLGLRGGWGPLRRFGPALAANATLLSLFSVIQMLSWDGKIYWIREVSVGGAGGPFVSHNHLAAYLNLGLGFALGELLAGGRDLAGGRRLAAAYATSVIAVGVVASLSRSGLVGMTVASAVTFAVLSPVSLSRAVWAGVAGAVGLAAAVLAAVGSLGPYRRLLTLLEAESYMERMRIWAGALRAWSSYPTWGLGLGSFSFAVERFTGVGEAGFIGHAENEYVEALTEGGVFGLALGLLALASVVVLGRRALAVAAGRRERAAALGGLFGVVATAAHCMSDFAMHIPAVALTAVIIAAHLTRVGLDARAPGSRGGALRRAASAAAALSAVAVGLFALGHGYERARAEFVLAEGGVTPIGLEMPTAALRNLPVPDLDRLERHLGRSLRYRPDSAEAHARRGLILLSLYRAAVTGILAEQVDDPARRDLMADPLWLHAVVHSTPADRIAAAGGVLAHEPVRRYLVPAARSFLEARRCCPVWGLPHAELAALDYLLRNKESTAVHADRALATAGTDSSTLMVAGVAAAHAGDLTLASACWRRVLVNGPEFWEGVADQAGALLPPVRVLSDVVPEGRYALWFADRLYADPASKPARAMFLRRALELLPRDRGLTRADRLHYEAQALMRLGETEPALSRMSEAVALEPDRGEWRRELVQWLIGWGRLREAHDVALVGSLLKPGDRLSAATLETAVDALSKGVPSTRDGVPR